MNPPRFLCHAQDRPRDEMFRVAVLAGLALHLVVAVAITAAALA